MLHRVLQSEAGNTFATQVASQWEPVSKEQISGRLEFENRHFQCACTLVYIKLHIINDTDCHSVDRWILCQNLVCIKQWCYHFRSCHFESLRWEHMGDVFVYISTCYHSIDFCSTVTIHFYLVSWIAEICHACNNLPYIWYTIHIYCK